MNRATALRLVAVAGFVFACALVALGARWPGYSHLAHPVALPGAAGVEGAWLFNAMVFVLPGALLAAVALWLRSTLSAAGWWPRIGANLLLLSALAFMAQGLLPLDADDFDATASRLHAAAWTVWLIAFAVGAPMFAQVAERARLPLRVGAMAVLLVALFGAFFLPVGVAQRLAFLGWFAWMWGAVKAVKAVPAEA
ncbi:MAG TPA: DUF998 domain-containing protein [Luteimonas sp.]|nr:DUF998 domain-containing protein [Luteimonas sp.]